MSLSADIYSETELRHPRAGDPAGTTCRPGNFDTPPPYGDRQSLVRAVGRSDESYRQVDGGPAPGVAIEVASESDSFPGLNAKRYRYSRLRVPAYIITVDVGALDVIRCDDDLERWVDRPIPELGGIRLLVDDNPIVARTPDDRIVRDAGSLVGSLQQRTLALEAQLRAAGIEPVPST